jgi:hypothetical protein
MTNCTCTTEAFSSGPMLIQCDPCATAEFRSVLAATAKGASEASRRANAAVASITK